MQVYMDNAATTKMSKKAIEAMLPYLNSVYGNPSSLHSLGQEAKEVLDEQRNKLAKMLGANENEIYFTSGGSESDNQAIISASIIGKRRGKTHIISTKIEHHAVLHTLKKLEKEGFSVTYLDVNEYGLIDLDDLKNAITDQTILVSVMYANNEIGTIEPIGEIGKICREKGVIFHTDAVQAVGHVKIDVEKECIDMLSLSAHKFHGPKGVGALYVKKPLYLTNLIEGGAQERGKRAGTENLAGIVSMVAALEESLGALDENTKKLTLMRDRLIEGLSKIEHSILNGDRKNRLSSNVNMCFEGIEGESLLLLLDMYGICASSGSACTSGSLDPSHVLLSIGRKHEIAHGSLRLSLSEETTNEEIDYVIEKVGEVVDRLRQMSPVWKDLEEGVREHVI